jgi:hypothetical protein
MKTLFRTAAILAATLGVATLVSAHDFDRDDDAAKPLTIALFGDWPYSQNLLNNAHLLINSVNADHAVSLVAHVGDIHSGSMPCTSAGILPPIATSSPDWNQHIFGKFQQFNAPFVYLPGDNEWADCHKAKQFSSGAPLKELANVRELFFSRPGVTLGKQVRRVQSQAEHFDSAFPTDSQFVENVMWHEGKVMFATFNIPGGSNDDTAPWTGIFADPTAQALEVAEREPANLRWLQRAFDKAHEEHAKAVVLLVQADMWDPEAIAPGGSGLNRYTPFIQLLADLSVKFGRPVLLVNGDTHLFESDHPLADPNGTTGKIHHTQAVPNLTRIVVQGSTNAPAEWLRLTIDVRTPQVFTWTNVPYCANPATPSCQ